MKGLDTGKDKVKKICDVLRQETLEPAIEQAKEIVEKAHHEAEEIIHSAQKEAKKLLHDAETHIAKQREIFETSLKQACHQTVEVLKMDVEKRLFQPALLELLKKPLQDPKVLAAIIDAIVGAIQKEGTDANLSVYISSSVSPRAINDLVTKEVLEKLKEKSVLLGHFDGGIEVKLHGQNLTIEISEASLKEILMQFVRKDFRQLFFTSP